MNADKAAFLDYLKVEKEAEQIKAKYTGRVGDSSSKPNKTDMRMEIMGMFEQEVARQIHTDKLRTKPGVDRISGSSALKPTGEATSSGLTATGSLRQSTGTRRPPSGVSATAHGQSKQSSHTVATAMKSVVLSHVTNRVTR